LSQARLKSGQRFRAVIVNSGNANCLNGRQGFSDALAMSRYCARALAVTSQEVLVASTGIIGRRLAVVKIRKALPQLVRRLSAKAIKEAQRAILTTDTFTKGLTATFSWGGKTITVCGVAKGAGMIAPDMATMLAFIFTDARISPAALKRALHTAVANSFNCISVDGCMSTNDSLMLLANGASANSLIRSGRGFNIFLSALERVCLGLAKLIVRDAEGASKFIEIRVETAENFSEAKKAAFSIANSNLFKTAVYAENPNFGRIAAALGASGIALKEEKLRIKVSPLTAKVVKVKVSLGLGKASAVVFTSDLTPAYIRINAEYN
jgi:glutamate N-acetyltransferase/amino-acid N-acetyltransferase